MEDGMLFKFDFFVKSNEFTYIHIFHGLFKENYQFS